MMTLKKGVFIIPVILAIILIGIPSTYVVTKNLNKPKLIRPQSHQSNPSAKINVVTFVDYECPPCVDEHETAKKVIDKNPGKINLVVRHRLGEGHENAELAANAAEAAADQGKFFEMNDKLLENQQEWVNSNNPQETIVKYAQDLNLDTTKFEQDIISNKYQDRIKKDEKDAMGFDISTIPATFINGDEVSFTSPNSDEELETQIAEAEKELDRLASEEEDEGSADQLGMYLTIAIALGVSLALILLLHGSFIRAKEREARMGYLTKKLMQFREWRYFTPKHNNEKKDSRK